MINMRVYPADVVEKMIDNLKDDYMELMRKHMSENNVDKVHEMSMAVTALGILEDRLFETDAMTMTIE